MFEENREGKRTDRKEILAPTVSEQTAVPRASGYCAAQKEQGGHLRHSSRGQRPKALQEEALRAVWIPGDSPYPR